jgi:hypothetical protein
MKTIILLILMPFAVMANDLKIAKIKCYHYSDSVSIEYRDMGYGDIRPQTNLPLVGSVIEEFKQDLRMCLDAYKSGFVIENEHYYLAVHRWTNNIYLYNSAKEYTIISYKTAEILLKWLVELK